MYNFNLYRNTEEGPVTNYKVKLNNRYEPIEESLRSLHYQSSKFATVFVIHGFTASINSTWMSEMAEAYLSRVTLFFLFFFFSVKYFIKFIFSLK